MTGKQIKKYRLNLGLNRTEFARLTGYSVAHIVKIEGEERKVPKVLLKLLECHQASKGYCVRAIKKAQVKPGP